MCGYVPGVNDLEPLDGNTDLAARTTESGSRGSSSMPAELSSSSPAERVIEAPEVGDRVLLAIDTSLGTSVAVSHAGRIAEVVSGDARGHAEVIGTLIARSLELAGVRGSEVTGVVAGMGPGPFTGLRVGIAAAQAFAVGRGVQFLPLLGHEAVALSVLQLGATASVRVVQDARRRELFVTDYGVLDWVGVPVRRGDPYLVTRVAHEPVAGEIWPERIPAARLVQLAARRLASGRDFEADRAVYLRAPDVKPSAGPKRVSGQSERTAFALPDSAATAAAHGAQRGVSA